MKTGNKLFDDQKNQPGCDSAGNCITGNCGKEIVEQLRAIRRELRSLLICISILTGCSIVYFLGLLS